MALISVAEATQIIGSIKIDFGTTTVPLAAANGRVLAEPLLAGRDFPAFNRVAMDGIAIRYDDFAGGQRSFPVFSVVAAGSPSPEEVPPQYCVEIMTGAVLPPSCDTVIRYEDLDITEGQASLLIDTIAQGQNIHRQGTDRKKGEILLTEGERIAAPEIGIAATIGKTEVLVRDIPAIALISTGDELVPIEDTPLPYQIRSSNTQQLSALLAENGFSSQIFHLPDDPEIMKTRLAALLSAYPLILLSGGVSKGKFDFLPQVLQELGVEKKLHRIAQRPGKPLWVGTHQHGAVFGLPGNPVSSFVGALRYVLPWLRQSIGYRQLFSNAALAEEFRFKPALTYFLPVELRVDEAGRQWAYPKEQGGSGNLAKLSLADAFLELPAEKEVFAKGEVFPCWRYRP